MRASEPDVVFITASKMPKPDTESALIIGALAAVPGATTYARVDQVETADGPCLMELELIEPELFLRFDDTAADRYARCLIERL